MRISASWLKKDTIQNVNDDKKRTLLNKDKTAFKMSVCTPPHEIIEQIIDFLPSSLNVCLVCKQFQRRRKPLTIIHQDSYSYILNNPWWVNELLLDHSDNRNVLEYLLYVCLQNENRDLFNIVVSKLSEDDPIYQRVQMYAHNTSINDFNLMSCILDGNLALFLHGLNTEFRVRLFHTMILCALQRRHLFLATYLILSDRYAKGIEEYGAFIEHANLELLKWFDRFRAYDDDFLILHLIVNDKVDEFKYFHHSKKVVITNQMLECAKRNRSRHLLTHLEKSMTNATV